jgi:hypothetical protein
VPVADAACKHGDDAPALAGAIRSVSLDSLADTVPLNVDLDVVLSVLAHILCTAACPATTPPPQTIQRRFLSTGGTITSHRT